MFEPSTSHPPRKRLVAFWVTDAEHDAIGRARLRFGARSTSDLMRKVLAIMVGGL